MSIDLTPDHQRMIERVLHSGGYRDAQEVISAALAALTEYVDDTESKERKGAIERLKTFGKTHGLSLGGISLRELRHEARP